MEDQNQAMADNYCAELLERKKLLNTDISLPPLENYLQNKTYLANKAKIAQHKQELEKQKAKLESEQKKTQKFTGNSTTDEAAKEVSDWNPYDQNQQCKWFSPKYMFDIDGFDIIIGNPPYIQLQNNGGKLAKEYENCKYESFAKTGDIYCLFYERAHQLLKEGGLCCYITSNKWMRAGYGEALRTFFANKTNPLLLIDFAGVKVFDSATVDTNILIFSKHVPQNQTLACSAKTLSKQDLKNLVAFVKNNTVKCNFPAGDSWVILSPIEQSIKRKIESVGTPLKDWDIQINYGIKTGFNDAFIITTEKKDEILAACATAEERQKTAEIIRPILRGRDIKRYGYDWAGLWLVYIPWHFPLHKDTSIQGASEKAEQAFKKQYPAIYQHLSQYKKQLSARNKAETGIRYEWYAMQRWGANYSDDFNKPKIVYPNMTKYMPFVYDEKQFVTNQK
ncbi:MAG: class I SAM-dependent DNA methyltransferase, partial [Bacteroidales bacterium]|nr:class I SAM-dependent DNA methyltransferase [Bacteroidales bacterium]